MSCTTTSPLKFGNLLRSGRFVRCGGLRRVAGRLVFGRRVFPPRLARRGLGVELVEEFEEVMRILDGRIGALVAPAARGTLAGDQTQGQSLDHRFIFVVAEPVEEEDAQRHLVGVVHRGERFADEGLRPKQHRVVLVDAALQQGQAGQGGVADRVAAVARPGAGGELGFFQERDALVDGLVDAVLLGGQGQSIRPRDGSAESTPKATTVHFQAQRRKLVMSCMVISRPDRCESA